MRFKQEATKEAEERATLRCGRLLPWGGAVSESLCRLTEISRSDERARGFGGEPMPCVRQSLQQPANFCTSSVILTGFPASTQ